jgi:hypothetical protein
LTFGRTTPTAPSTSCGTGVIEDDGAGEGAGEGAGLAGRTMSGVTLSAVGAEHPANASAAATNDGSTTFATGDSERSTRARTSGAGVIFRRIPVIRAGGVNDLSHLPPRLRQRSMFVPARSTGYWITTSLLAFGMTLGGTGQLLRARFNVEGIMHLGYPVYVLSILGAWKLAGVIVLLAPRLQLAKEWAYAGFFFLLTSGTVSHLASGDTLAQATPPFVFACLTALSWWLRPADRRLALRGAQSPHGPLQNFTTHASSSS